MINKLAAIKIVVITLGTIIAKLEPVSPSPGKAASPFKIKNVDP